MANSKKKKRQVKIDENVVLQAIDRINNDPVHTGRTIGGYFESLHVKDTQQKDGRSNTVARGDSK